MSDRTTVDFDHHSAAFAADPFGTLARLRQLGPIVWTEAHGGYWVVTDHEHVAEAFRDYATFSSASGATIPDLSLGTSHIPITVDPPDHTGYRHILVPLLSRSALEHIEPAVRQTVSSLIDAMVERGSWDFVDDFAAIVPAAVTLRLLGFPEQHWARFREAMRRSLEQAGTTTASDVAGETAWLTAQIRSAIDRRRTRPTDDLLSQLVRGDLGDRPLTEQELIDLYLNLFIGGFHTTIAALSSTVVHLQSHPDDRAALVARSDLIPAAIEELIRCYPPAMGMARTVRADTSLDGVSMGAGEKVLLSIAAANRDPAVFTDPDTVDFGRTSTNSVGWGWGVHRCVGIHFARIMLRIEIEMLLERVPDFVVDEAGVERASSLGVSYHFDRIPTGLRG